MKKNILLTTALVGALSFSATAEAATVKCLITFNKTTEKQYGGFDNVKTKVRRAERSVRTAFKNKNYKTKLKMSVTHRRLNHTDTLFAGQFQRERVLKGPEYTGLRRIRNKGKYDLVVLIERVRERWGRVEMSLMRNGWFNLVDESNLDDKFHNRLAVARGFGLLLQAQPAFAGETRTGGSTLMTTPSRTYPAKKKHKFLSGTYSRNAGFIFGPKRSKANNARRVENRHWWVSKYK